MKRLALLSVVALMLASAVFAPVAMAQEPGEVDIQSVTLGPEGSLQVTGTIECVEGQYYNFYLEARQKQGNKYRLGSTSTDGVCQTTGPESFSLYVFGGTPFKKGTVVVSGQRYFCIPNLCSYRQFGPETFDVR
jgi:hypothetical protein